MAFKRKLEEEVVEKEFNLDDLVNPDVYNSDEVYPLSDIVSKAIIGGLVTNLEVLHHCYQHLDLKCFIVNSDKLIAKCAYSLLEKYGHLPTKIMLMTALREELKDSPKDRVLYLAELGVQFEYCQIEPTAWIIEQATKHAVTMKMKYCVDAYIKGKPDDSVKLYGEALALQAGPVAYPLYTDDELSQLPATAWIVEGHIPAGGLTTIVATSNAGKTFYALDLAYSAASGLPFLGKHATKAGPVAYVYSEGVSGAQARAKAWKDYHRVTLAPVIFIPVSLDFGELATGDTLIEKMKKKCGTIPSLIVIDTLSDNFGDGDLNDNRDMISFLNTLSVLRQKHGCAVVVTHHTGWGDAKREVGSKQIRNRADVTILLERNESTVNVTYLKMRDGAFPDPYQYQTVVHLGSLVLVPNSAAVAVTATVVETDLTRISACIPITLDPKEGATLRSLIDATHISRSKMQRYLSQGENLGSWHCSDTSDNNKPSIKYYRLV